MLLVGRVTDPAVGTQSVKRTAPGGRCNIVPQTLEPPAIGPVIGTRGRGTSPPWQPSETPGPPRWRWIGMGFLCAWLAGFVAPHGFTWFLCAIPHEMGHATVGCLLGHPSTPAISLRGEAWTGIAELRPWLVWMMAIAFAIGAGCMRHRPFSCIALGVTALMIPAVAFTKVADILITFGGHVGELAFATYCYALAWTGGRTDTPQERVACAMAGGLLQYANLRLCFGLLTSPAARDLYARNGSIGIKNDYLVLSEDLLGWSLNSVALFMFVVALAPLPLGLLIGRWREHVGATDSQ